MRTLHGDAEATKLIAQASSRRTKTPTKSVYPGLSGLHTAGSSCTPPRGHFPSLSRFWKRRISIPVAHETARDHLGMPLQYLRSQDLAAMEALTRGTALERTFLAYSRTSLTFAQLGVVVAQLFRLQNHSESQHLTSLFALGRPVACICYGIAIVLALCGAYRFWRQQNAMTRGKICAGGWEPWIIAIATLLVCPRSHCTPKDIKLK